ncbi:RNA polymerase-binding protein DksA [Acinetobacter cumulans]|uniref:RNA polymerase-binding transcription factor DksA n=1 Tax=Acinetobacter cumulans TaxID=2136182 RepID=A0A3A8GHT8_9GAMM|nr:MULTISPECIES: RNA polymerase-binding protein DksA [Acinetobacter]NWK72743.1 RNA polymerase-binding protein DksA [Acinetobacter sp. SwsAc6]QCO20537.1 RNA polymerase-binding protein DksA [Acinetobacter cumulans]RFS33341.1 RNA polymerase-binding protein DksA [Acinetobacter sp. SWAC5]RKG46028.1 RNA polymerase-binding protein DksA [Acinetobacter cumulans]RKG47976.1 RNA polymerase-binding protein DksA [Acinetobacter cumulans]
MANDNQNQVLDEQTDVAEEKSVKRVRKTKPKSADGGSTASLFGIEPYQPKKNEEYMSEGQLQHFRNILLAWKSELMSEVDRTLNTMQDENTALPDVNDRATQEEEFAIELRTRDRERKLIRKIEQSIEAIKNDDYGFCETCGIEIGLRRLEARPTATLCIDCKTLAEIKEKQNNG